MTALTHPTLRRASPKHFSLTQGTVPGYEGWPASRPRRTVDLSALHDFDQARLRALLFRSREHTTQDWLEAIGATADVRFVDGHEADTASASLNRSQATIQIVDSSMSAHQVHERHRLMRPLLLGAFVDVLLRLEAYLPNCVTHPIADASAEPLEPHYAAGDSHETVNTAVGLVPANRNVYTVSPAFRLRKWPPVKLLLREDSHAQVATLFSAQPLTIAQASRIGRVRYAQCWAFIRECMAMGIVEVHQPAPVVSQPESIVEHRIGEASTIRRTQSSRLFTRLVAYFG